MYIDNKIIVGKNSEKESCIIPKMINRHGLITGATGSGKTTTVKVLAESFADAGIPVMMIDVKGDIAGTCLEGEEQEWISKKVNKYNLDFSYKKYSVNFFDVFKKSGIPIRTTVEKIGSRLLSRILGLSEAGEGVLAIAFQVAKDEGKTLYDLNDLRDLLLYIGENKNDYMLKYGNITTASLSTIGRNILQIEQEGGNEFFGEPQLDFYDLMQYDFNGKGFINILDAQELYKNPTLYACVLVWLLNSLYDYLPEVGDLERPKFVLFLDEAHLIFSEMNNELIKKITSIIKLIRSKGVGVYFISQSPSDIPNEILGQLGNKIGHVLRSYTPNDEKTIKAAASSFRTNPNFDTCEAIKNLGTGEALVSFLNELGEPSIVEKTSIVPPQSYCGPISDSIRDTQIKSSRIYAKYYQDINNISASEKIEEVRKKKTEEEEKLKKEKEDAKEKEQKEKELAKKKLQEEKAALKRKKQSEKIVRQIENKVVNKATTKIVNSLWKSLFK